VIIKLYVVGYILVVSIHPARLACQLFARALPKVPIYHGQAPIVNILIKSLSELFAIVGYNLALDQICPVLAPFPLIHEPT
jgi:hypothetical protein